MLCPEPEVQVSLHYEYIIPREGGPYHTTPPPTTSPVTDQLRLNHPRLLHDINYEENMLSWRDSYGRIHNYGYNNRLEGMYLNVWRYDWRHG